jgi:hypothetical protein
MSSILTNQDDSYLSMQNLEYRTAKLEVRGSIQNTSVCWAEGVHQW